MECSEHVVPGRLKPAAATRPRDHELLLIGTRGAIQWAHVVQQAICQEEVVEVVLCAVGRVQEARVRVRDDLFQGILELSAPLILLWYRRTGLFLGLALSFHLGTSLMLNIHFTNLWPCYIALVPWESGLTQVQAPGFCSHIRIL